MTPHATFLAPGAGCLLTRDVGTPASLPVIFAGLRIARGIGWMCVVTAQRTDMTVGRKLAAGPWPFDPEAVQLGKK
jgi:hypothetical protein